MNWIRNGWRGALLAGVLLCIAAPTGANEQLSDESFAVNARAHAHALKTAYYRLEEHILRGSTAATTWSGDTPPSSTGWLDTWTDRGLRARYCADSGQPGVLLVYMGRAALMGVGTDQRSVQAGPRLFGGERRNLHWLDGDIARGGGGRADVTLPACMSALVPSGRAALAGTVEDPWTTTRPRVSWERRELLDCPTGTHRPASLGAKEPARIERRSMTRQINGRGKEVGTPTKGAWTIAVDLCEADYTVTETEHRSCTYTLAGETVSGYEIWTRQKSVTASGMSGVWSKTYTTCETGPLAALPSPAGTAETLPTPTITYPTWTETQPVSCGYCMQGTASRSRVHTDRHVTFAWDSAPTVQKDVQISSWVTDSSGCSPVPPTEWTVVRTESRTVACGTGYTGSLGQQRSVTDLHSRPCGGTTTVTQNHSATGWTTVSGSCTPDSPCYDDEGFEVPCGGGNDPGNGNDHADYNNPSDDDNNPGTGTPDDGDDGDSGDGGDDGDGGAGAC